jgi:hypothetical protein
MRSDRECTSNCSASRDNVRSPLDAARAIFAFKAGVWFRSARLVIVLPIREPTLPAVGQNSTCRTVRIFQRRLSWALSQPHMFQLGEARDRHLARDGFTPSSDPYSSEPGTSQLLRSVSEGSSPNISA